MLCLNSAFARSISVCVVISSCIGLPCVSAAQEKTSSYGPPPTAVRVVAVTEQSLAPRKQVFGELRPARFSTIASEEAGIVRSVLVREGDLIERGAVIAKLDGTRLHIEVKMNLHNIASAEAMVAERSASLLMQQRQLELIRKASEEGATNPREILDAQSKSDIAKSQSEQVAQSMQALEKTKELLTKRLGDLDLRAPFGGVVVKKHTEVGEWISEGAPIIDLAETAMLEAWFEVPQELFEAAVAEVGRTRGEPTTPSPIEVRTASQTRVVGKALRVIPAIDPRSRTFYAVLDVTNENGALAAGLALTAYVPAGPLTPRLIIPKDALLRGDAGAFVYAVRGGVAVPVNVRVAFPVGDNVALEACALESTDQVVVEGNERLMPMSAVVAIETPRTATPTTATTASPTTGTPTTATPVAAGSPETAGDS